MSPLTTEIPLESPGRLRSEIAAGRWGGDLRTIPQGYTQSSVLMLPQAYAADFLRFCQLNSKAAGLLHVGAPGDPEPGYLAPGGDIRTDLHSYRIWRNGELAGTCDDISGLWREDMVAFYLGCSLTFEHALTQAGVVRGEGRVYTTTVPAQSVGAFATNLAVTMRPMDTKNAIRAIQVTSRFPATHGGPIHFGDPGELGLEDLSKPDFGSAPTLAAGEVPVFWACSATAVLAAQAAKPDLMLTFDPPYMLITDRRVEETSVL
ncbi:DUF1445 domain-containing protein [Arthrobacter sp. zg-Y1219]|uniref:D-glutamate cyclase family protein n=1 Tax=Arthrobacter sp. zg-Y1219 TaxID=3049067 RepID=UPI0024C25A95|nr:DUF1445 domain-containing protein [Arthrobacter sp. zg-Y1219]MDK1361682.1 DUF1445 domain-containing protein [Arthrobacter sp. zg-Y1219]